MPRGCGDGIVGFEEYGRFLILVWTMFIGIAAAIGTAIKVAAYADRHFWSDSWVVFACVMSLGAWATAGGGVFLWLVRVLAS